MSRSFHEEVRASVSDEAAIGGFFGSLLAGFLMGLGLDAWLGTGPGLTIAGIVAGAATGFWRAWQIAKESDAAHRR